MFGLETLDVLIGLVTVYLVMGLALTAIVEAISTWLKLRSINLEAALKELFAGELTAGEPFVQAFYAHPLVQALSKGKDGRPSYIPPEVVGRVVESLLAARGAAATLAAAVRALPDTAPAAAQPGATPAGAPEPNRVKGLLATLVAESGENLAAFRRAVEQQYDATMERASGWFKRHTQTVALVAAAVLVVGANVDTVELAVSLASSPEARVKMVDVAQQALRERQAMLSQVGSGQSQEAVTPEQAAAAVAAARATLAEANANMASAGLAMGWTAWPTARQWPAKAAGLLVSIFAVSLGAPFWFDVLQRFMQVRAAGRKDEVK